MRPWQGVVLVVSFRSSVVFSARRVSPRSGSRRRKLGRSVQADVLTPARRSTDCTPGGGTGSRGRVGVFLPKKRQRGLGKKPTLLPRRVKAEFLTRRFQRA